MVNINVDLSELIKKYFIPIVISSIIGLILYATLFDGQWIWPVILGGISFLVIELVIWCYERMYENDCYQRRMEAAKIREESRLKREHDELLREAKIFFINCKEDALNIYNHPRSDSDDKNERTISMGATAGYTSATRIDQYELDTRNEKYRFMYCDNYDSCHINNVYHIVFHPVFYSVVEEYANRKG